MHHLVPSSSWPTALVASSVRRPFCSRETTRKPIFAPSSIAPKASCCDTDDKEDCSPIVGSDAKQGKDEDIVRPPRGKRRRVNTSVPTTRKTAPSQTRPHCTNFQSPDVGDIDDVAVRGTSLPCYLSPLAITTLCRASGSIQPPGPGATGQHKGCWEGASQSREAWQHGNDTRSYNA